MYPEDVFGRNSQRLEERLPRHTVVRLGVIRLHGAFVAEEEANAVPRHGVAAAVAGQQRVHRPRGRTAGERDVGNLAIAQRDFHDADEPIGRGLGKV